MKIRNSKPEKGNKFYNTVANGGLSLCVKGSPVDNDCDVLPNCFAGETKYVTEEGLKDFESTVGTVQMVLNENGEFVPAEIKSFGIQKLYKLTFNNNHVVYATGNHRWVVDSISSYKDKKYKKRKIKTTLELTKSDLIPYNFYKGNNKLDNEGIVHGIVYGDGHKNNNCDTYKVELFGNKEELRKYLPKHIKSDYNLKEVPSIYESEEYLRGFVAGLIATDGTITEDTFKISSVNLEDLKQILNICYKIGIGVGGIYSEVRDVNIGNYEYKNHCIYYLTFKRENIEQVLIKESDLEKIKESKNIQHTKVKSIEPTDREELVYCAVEPLTHTITLEKNILTGQCVGYACGRFNEIIGEMKYPKLYCNAENFIEQAKNIYGLEVVDYPVLGGIMVFQKGNTLNGNDGAGHVFIVEKFINEDEIQTSESAYGGQAFYTNIRNKNNNWNMDSSYSFRGCIVNPAIGKVVYVKPVESKKTVDELAKEVLEGKWKNGAERKELLENAGYNYNEVQDKVNFLVKKRDELKPGDKVFPIEMVDYKGTPIVSYDKEYEITCIDGRGAVLSAVRGNERPTWAVVKVDNLKRI